MLKAFLIAVGTVLVLGGCGHDDAGSEGDAFRQSTCDSFKRLTPAQVEYSQAMKDQTDPSISVAERQRLMDVAQKYLEKSRQNGGQDIADPDAKCEGAVWDRFYREAQDSRASQSPTSAR